MTAQKIAWVDQAWQDIDVAQIVSWVSSGTLEAPTVSFELDARAYQWQILTGDANDDQQLDAETSAIGLWDQITGQTQVWLNQRPTFQ